MRGAGGGGRQGKSVVGAEREREWGGGGGGDAGKFFFAESHRSLRLHFHFAGYSGTSAKYRFPIDQSEVHVSY